MAARRFTLCFAVVAVAAASEELRTPLILYRGAFSPEECAGIARIFTELLPAESDARAIQNLPRMADDYGVARLNRFDTDGRLQAAGVFDWIYERVAAQLGEPGLDIVLGAGSPGASGVARLGKRVDFNLMHEFDARHSRFDWCGFARRAGFGLAVPLYRSIYLSRPMCARVPSSSQVQTPTRPTVCSRRRHVDTKPGDGTLRTYNVNVMLSAAEEYEGGGLQVNIISLLFLFFSGSYKLTTPRLIVGGGLS